MYIENLHYTNIGPIEDIYLEFGKNNDGNPRPTIIVGKNGSGKSILLSNIVDAFYEIATMEYNNATFIEKNSYQYYKEISPIQIKIGKNFMVSHIVFDHNNQKIEYIFKCGDIVFNEYKDKYNKNIDNKLSWNNEKNFKANNVNKNIITDIFNKDIICFFGPNRFMKPSWLGSKYYSYEKINNFSTRSNYAHRLNNPISAQSMSEITQQWLFDIIADARPDVTKKSDGTYTIESIATNLLDSLNISRQNVEKLMSEILEEDVYFLMQNRAHGTDRFIIMKKSDNRAYSPSLQALSTGQLTLFNLFATIIRYADTDDVNLSFNLNEIKGIVVIDEIELHLHPSLQCRILPKLIALFPRVQFIITSHSPIFLLGMKEQFKEENFDIIEMSSGKKISSEEFCEFNNAYMHFKNTEKYKQDLKEALDLIDKESEKPLIITEGPSDWIHMEAAFNKLSKDKNYSDIFSKLDIEFFKYETKDSKLNKYNKLDMGNTQLENMCKETSKIKHKRKIIFIADCDVPDTLKSMGENNPPYYKNWGNNVYSLCLPVPKFRENTPKICIEHYYKDEEIKTKVDICGVQRRLFMGNDFNNKGFSKGLSLYCKNASACGTDKINIIDGSGKNKVTDPNDDSDDSNNFALSKMTFAEYIYEAKEPFDKIDFSNFVSLFKIIGDIINK